MMLVMMTQNREMQEVICFRALCLRDITMLTSLGCDIILDHSHRRNIVYAFAANFRLIILRKIPTVRKSVCALVVVVGEFISLLPSIIPSLQPSDHHHGGDEAHGYTAALWSLCYLAGLVSGQTD